MMTIKQIQNLTEAQVKDLIRIELMKEGATDKSDHDRFEMSGYESNTGECTVKNINILNKFAYLGIYDFTTFLFLDFYKGSPKLYLQYFWDNEIVEEDYTGYGTTDIIYLIFKLTILSGKPQRRRG